jgi:Domain of unknown function (DUF4352)
VSAPRPPSNQRRPAFSSGQKLFLQFIAATVLIACCGVTAARVTTGRYGRPPAAVNTNIPVRDGRLEFLVQGVKCGAEGPNTTCRVALAVKNISEKPQTLREGYQRAVGTNDARYKPREAGWIVKLAPGNETSGVLIFDMPRDVLLAQLVLHDSAFSDGVTVKVR